MEKALRDRGSQVGIGEEEAMVKEWLDGCWVFKGAREVANVDVFCTVYCFQACSYHER